MLPAFLSLSYQSRNRDNDGSTSAPSNRLLRSTNVAIPRLGNPEHKTMGRPPPPSGGEKMAVSKTEEGLLTIVNAVERLARDELSASTATAAAPLSSLPPCEPKRKRSSDSACYSDILERALRAAPAPFLTEEEEVVHQRAEEEQKEEDVGDHRFRPVDSQQELMSPKRRKTGT